jgi:flagellar export protein FliJ
MAQRKFVFGPQPALDKAVAEQEQAEEAVVLARRVLQEEQERLRQMLVKVEQTRRDIRQWHDDLVSPAKPITDPNDLTHRGRYLDALRQREKEEVAAAERQRQEVAWAEDRLELRKKELAEAMAAVQALERLKEKRREEHEAVLEKAEESRRDDDAIQLWNNRPE